VKWNSWNATGSREVHGLRWEETEVPITPQDVYTRCRFYNTKEWLLCNNEPEILEDWEHWKTLSKSAIIFARAQTVTSIPGGIPYFFSRCTVSRDLFDLIIELRPSSTPGGLTENIKHEIQYMI
jgi:hypothetical protein